MVWKISPNIRRPQSEPRLKSAGSRRPRPEEKLQKRLDWIQNFFAESANLPLLPREKVTADPLYRKTFGKKIAWGGTESSIEGAQHRNSGLSDEGDQANRRASQRNRRVSYASDSWRRSREGDSLENPNIDIDEDESPASSADSDFTKQNSITEESRRTTISSSGPLPETRRKSIIFRKSIGSSRSFSFVDVSKFSNWHNEADLTEEEVVAIFRRCTHGRMECLAEASVLIEVFAVGGYPYQMNWQLLEEVITDQTVRSFVETDDWVAIWQAYFEKVSDSHRSIFMKSANGRECLTESELPAVFRSIGFWPMPGALAEAEREIMQQKKGIPLIEFEDFVKIYKELYSRAGLTKSEHHHSLEIFKLYAGDKKSLDSTALHSALKALGAHFLLSKIEPFILPDCLIDALVNEAVTQVMHRRLSLDMDAWSHVLETTERFRPQDGSIHCEAFLVVCNVLHLCIADHVESAAERVGLSLTGKFCVEKDVPVLFDELGHVSPQLDRTLQDIQGRCGLEGKRKLTFGEVYTVLLFYCSMEGFSSIERKELVRIFDWAVAKAHDVEKDHGLVSVSEIQKMLRWLCYVPSQHRYSDFMDKYVCESGFMDANDFTKVVADYRYANIGMARTMFRRATEDNGVIQSTWQSVGVADLAKLFSIVGHACTTAELSNLKKQAKPIDGKISWREFLRLEAFYRESVRESMKENSGFTHMECIALRAEFSKYTLSNCDAILYGGFEKLVVKVIPHMKDNIKMNKNLQKWSQDPHVSQNNRIEFKGFLWILRRLVDKDNKESMIRAKFLREELGYDKKQVQDLRELFKITDTDLSGSVDVSELSVLFSGLVDMSGDAHKDLMRFVEELDSNDEEALDFFDFLRLMKKLEDRNWRNISRLADHQVETGEAPLEESMLMYKGKSAMMSKGSGHEFML